jgi:hypothetical protein
MTLTKHTGTTKDNNGCEFEYAAYLTKEWDYIDGRLKKIVLESHYVCKNLTAKGATSLAELKEIVAELK